MTKIIIAAAMTLTLSGCFSSPEMVLELNGGDGEWRFYDQGFPTDLRLTDEGRPDFSGFPHRLFSPLVMEFAREAERYDQMTGYAPDTPVYIRFTGTFEPEEFSLPQSANHFADASSVIQLIDVDPDSPLRGKRYPIAVDFRYEEDEYRPASLFEAIPIGQIQQENTTYALIITRDIAGEYADDLNANPVLTSLLKGKNPRYKDLFITASNAEKALQVYAPLKDQLELDGIDPDDVIAAVVWTTGAATSKAFELGQIMTQWEVPPLLSAWEMTKDMPEFCVYEAQWSVPGLQKGLFPFPSPIFGGDIEYDLNGEPIVQYWRETPAVITIPKTPMPSEGYPMLLFHHGAYGLAEHVWSRGKEPVDGEISTYGSAAHVASLRGWAAAGMGGHFGHDHQQSIELYDAISETVGIPLNALQFNFYNPQGFRDNLLQQLSERILFRRLIEQAHIDTRGCIGSNQGDAVFNPQQTALMGQFLGAFTAAAQIAVDPAPLAAYIATGPGTYNMKLFLQNKQDPEGSSLGNILEPLFFYTDVDDIVEDPFHPVYALGDQFSAPSNTSLMLAKREQLNNAGQMPFHSLMIFGHVDNFVPLSSQKPLIRALESDMAGPELDVSTELSLLASAQAAGGEALDYPVSGNGHHGETNAFTRYQQDEIKTGHHVMIQLEAPKHQIGCFLQDIAVGITPQVVEGSAIDGACASGPALLETVQQEPF